MKKLASSDYTLAANTLRGLSMDAIQTANSGHPGICLGMAVITFLVGFVVFRKTESKFILYI